jgi:hypothetical protein
LLEMARREPHTSEEADDLVRRLLEQANLHHRLVAVWNAAPRIKAIESLKRLIKELKDADNAQVRKADSQDVLDAKLDVLVSRLKPPFHVPDFPEAPVPRAGVMRATGMTPVNWETGSNNFTGWATLDAPSLGQLSRRAATSARALASINLRMERKSLRLVDMAWTGAALGLASVSYGLTGYSDTWGSSLDMLTAFAAGAVGTVAIDWAALPIFQSIRLRASDTP